jgi:hypothetical protein
LEGPVGDKFLTKSVNSVKTQPSTTYDFPVPMFCPLNRNGPINTKINDETDKNENKYGRSLEICRLSKESLRRKMQMSTRMRAIWFWWEYMDTA